MLQRTGRENREGRKVKEIIVDNFAGGGGASTGIEMATGYSVDIAINHDPDLSFPLHIVSGFWSPKDTEDRNRSGRFYS